MDGDHSHTMTEAELNVAVQAWMDAGSPGAPHISHRQSQRALTVPPNGSPRTQGSASPSPSLQASSIPTFLSFNEGQDLDATGRHIPKPRVINGRRVLIKNVPGKKLEKRIPAMDQKSVRSQKSAEKCPEVVPKGTQKGATIQKKRTVSEKRPLGKTQIITMVLARLSLQVELNTAPKTLGKARPKTDTTKTHTQSTFLRSTKNLCKSVVPILDYAFAFAGSFLVPFLAFKCSLFSRASFPCSS